MDIKTLIKNISMIVGIATIGFAGLFFILFVDLYLKGSSLELFLGIAFPLLSIVFLILAESFKHKPILFYVFKGVAIVAGIAFVVYAFKFMGTATFEKNTFLKLIKEYDGKKVLFLNAEKFNDGIDIKFNKMPIYITMIVASILGCIGVSVNTAMNAVIGLD